MLLGFPLAVSVGAVVFVMFAAGLGTAASAVGVLAGTSAGTTSILWISAEEKRYKLFSLSLNFSKHF